MKQKKKTLTKLLQCFYTGICIYSYIQSVHAKCVNVNKACILVLIDIHQFDNYFFIIWYINAFYEYLISDKGRCSVCIIYQKMENHFKFLCIGSYIRGNALPIHKLKVFLIIGRFLIFFR